MADLISELKGLIESDRIEEAKTLLEDFSRWPEDHQQAAIETLALASDDTGLSLIDFLMAGTPEKSLQERLFQLATDRAHLNYAFTGLLLAHGTLEQLRHSIPLLKHVMSKATKGDLLNRILRTAGKLKLEALTDDVAEFIFYDDDDLKRESVKALERMGNQTALKHLEHIAGTDKCDEDILDAIDMLREKLNPGDAGALESPHAEPPEEIPPRAKEGQSQILWRSKPSFNAWPQAAWMSGWMPTGIFAPTRTWWQRPCTPILKPKTMISSST